MCVQVVDTNCAEFVQNSRNIHQIGFIELWVLTANVFLAGRAKNKLQALNME